MYKFLPAVKEHAVLMEKVLLPDVKRELGLLSDKDTVAMIEKSIETASDAWTVFYGGTILCMFGVTPKSLLSNTAYIWLLTSGDIRKHLKEFFLCGPIALAYWFRTYDVLENYIPSGVPKLVRFAEKFGFTVNDPIHNLYHVEKRKT